MCERIAAPVLVGILRPIILLPPAAITGWTPDEIEMVLLHELAHVRRWDNLVNLVQRIIESLLFFHPAVWLGQGLGGVWSAGYGIEAVEAILDVAGQYDFSLINDGTVEEKLKETILDELADPSYPTNQPMAEHWLPVLATRIEKEPKKWRWLTANLAPSANR